MILGKISIHTGPGMADCWAAMTNLAVRHPPISVVALAIGGIALLGCLAAGGGKTPARPGGALDTTWDAPAVRPLAEPPPRPAVATVDRPPAPPAQPAATSQGSVEPEAPPPPGAASGPEPTPGVVPEGVGRWEPITDAEGRLIGERRRVLVRAYTPWDRIDSKSIHQDGYTATMRDTRTMPACWGIAADPRLFPYGSRIHVPGYAPSRYYPERTFWPVDDTGGRLRQLTRRGTPMIELRYRTGRAAREWGTRWVTVEVLYPR